MSKRGNLARLVVAGGALDAQAGAIWRFDAAQENVRGRADLELNLPAGAHSHSLRRDVAVEATRSSFDGALDAVERFTGQKVGQAPSRRADPFRGPPLPKPASSGPGGSPTRTTNVKPPRANAR
ncbi:hypothetical protein [Frankia sp. Cj3]|uniref:hypothetical protein n=1 Tax=Frankia sp. Cj3 TaxID=2880976 RepID=UPI001EF51EFD|nr:hypothetical protein [Frankia sp. Cj3]